MLASMSERELLPVDGWPELLKQPRVVLLAEAGSGKTAEMREQARQFARQGKFAFFVALESLDREALTEIMSAEEERAFKSWKADGRLTAWFFLASVDELKLTQGKLDRALRRFQRRLTVTWTAHGWSSPARPTNWRSVLDLATVQAKLHVVPKQAKSSQAPEEMFLAALRHEGRGDGARTRMAKLKPTRCRRSSCYR